MAVSERAKTHGYNLYRDHRPRGIYEEIEGVRHAVTGWPHEDMAGAVHLKATGMEALDMSTGFSEPQAHRWHQRRNVRDTGIPPAGIYDGVVDVMTGQDVDVSRLRTVTRAVAHSYQSKTYQSKTYLMVKDKVYVWEGDLDSATRESVNKPMPMPSRYGPRGTWSDLRAVLDGVSELDAVLDPVGINHVAPLYSTPVDLFEQLQIVQVIDTSQNPQLDARSWEYLSGAHPMAMEFAQGIPGRKPEPVHVAMIDRIMKAVEEKTEEAEYSVDDDGAVSFETTLRTGRFIMCEVSLSGNINAGIYSAADGDMVEFLACPSEEDLLTWF